MRDLSGTMNSTPTNLEIVQCMRVLRYNDLEYRGGCCYIENMRAQASFMNMNFVVHVY